MLKQKTTIMASKTETGHAKNVANFKTLISFCTGYKAKYNPFRQSLTLKSLKLLAQQAGDALDGVKQSKTTLDNAINARRVQFAGLQKFSTQVVKTFKSADVPKEAKADAAGHQRKIQGARAKAIKTTTATTVAAEAAQVKHISVAQLSFDSVLDNFQELVVTVSSQPAYQPNEAELAADGLQKKVEELNSLNVAVADAITGWSNARID